MPVIRPYIRPLADAGFTLIEVMVGFVLVAILLIGMNQFWVVVSGQIDGQIIRQKAVFRANGEMERLVELYIGNSAQVDADIANFNSDGYDVVPVGHVASGLITTSPARFIYDSTVLGFVTTTFDEFREELTSRSTAADANTVYSRVFFYDDPATAQDRNVVWLDREKGVVARLSWILDRTGFDQAGRPCFVEVPLNECFLLTLFLDFPFRVGVAANPLQPFGNVPLETITLQTIVGPRR